MTPIAPSSSMAVAAATAVRMLKHYQVEHTLGSGLQGKVKLGINTQTQERVALKIIDCAKLNRKAMINVYREVEAMSRVQHPHVLKLISVYDELPYVKKNGTTTQVILIVLELATGGELFDFMMYTGCFSETIARTYFCQLIYGLEECHRNGVYHRDIKPENLLLDGNFALKIGDFGLSGLREGPNGATVELYTQCGTRSYMSPEVLSCLPYEGAPADIWSAGVVLFIMLAGFPPFQIATRQDWWFRACAAGQYDAFWAAHTRSATFSPRAMALLSRVFRVNPIERITLQEIKNDPWFQEMTVSEHEFRTELLSRQTQVESQKRKEREQKIVQQQQEMEQHSKTNGKTLSEEFDPFEMDTMRSVTSSIISDRGSEAFVDRLSSIASSTTTISEMNSMSTECPLYPKSSVALYTRFESTKPPTEVQSRIEQALREMNACFVTKRDRFKTKVVMKTEQVSFAVRIYALSHVSDRCVAECRRTSGNCFAFQQMYKKLCALLTDVICQGDREMENENSTSTTGDVTCCEELISDEAMMI